MGQFICHGCVADPVLGQLVKATGALKKCRFCERRGKCLPLDSIASKVDDIFASCVEDVEDEPEFDMDSDGVRWVRRGETPSQIVGELLRCDHQVAEAIVETLRSRHAFVVHKDGERDWYDDGNARYVKSFHATADVAEAWNAFCSTLKHESRFLNLEAIKALDGILKDAITGTLPGLPAPIAVFGGPGSDERLFRARQADGLATQKAILSALAGQMGPPPPGRRSAGRMNAAGIGAFYAALDPKTCLAELRSPVGSSAIVAQFEALRPMRLLDLRHFDRISEPDLSPFLPGFFRTLGHIRFLSRFHQEIRKPILSDAAPIEYVPTQYIAEYLAQPEFGLDGIMFSSAQVTDGVNVVIFARSCEIDTSIDKAFANFEVDLRPDSMRDSDDIEQRLELTRHAESRAVREAALAAKSLSAREGAYPWEPDPEPAQAEFTLRLCDDSVTLVKAIEIRYETETIPVVLSEPTFQEELDALPF